MIFQTITEVFQELFKQDQASDILEYTVGVYRAVAWVVILFTVAIYLVMYVFLSLSASKAIKRENVGKVWWAYIPFLQLYALVQTSRQKRFLGMSKTVFAIIFPISAAVYAQLRITCDFMPYGLNVLRFLFSSGDAARNNLWTIIKTEESVYYTFVEFLSIMAGGYYTLCLFIFLRSYLRFRTPSYRWLSILFGIIFAGIATISGSVLGAIFPLVLFIFRNKEIIDYSPIGIITGDYTGGNYGGQSFSGNGAPDPANEPFSDFGAKQDEPFSDFGTKKEEPFSDFGSSESKPSSDFGGQIEGGVNETPSDKDDDKDDLFD